MSIDSKQIKRLIFLAAKIPVLLLLLGSTLTALSSINEIFPLTSWKRLFDITDRIGLIIIAIAITAFFYNFIILLCRKFEKQLKDDHLVASLVLSIVRKGLRIIFFLVCIYIIIALLEPNHLYLTIAYNIISTVVIISIGWVAIQVLYTSETVLYQRMLKLTHDQHLRLKALYTKLHIIRNIATVLIVILVIATILMSYSSVRNVGISLLASAGFLTAIIGLAAQRTLVSLFAGLQIALSQPIKIGDMVVINNESGLVEEITLTYVTLKLGDRRRLIIPINHFIEKSFENWSHDGHSLRCSLHLNVDYMMPIEPLRKELNRILEKSSYWNKVAQKLQVSNLTDRSVEIRIQVSAANADDLADLRAEVQEEMLAFIQKNYPQHFPATRLTKPHEIETS